MADKKSNLTKIRSPNCQDLTLKTFVSVREGPCRLLDIDCFPRNESVSLTQDQARQLIPLLERYVRTGKLQP